MKYLTYCFFISILMMVRVLYGGVVPDGYRVETISTPEDVFLEVGGIGFLQDGSVMFCSREGQVWQYKNKQWSLFADGLYEPLGLYVDPKTDDIFVVQRPELTQLIDTDHDGKADYYKTVGQGWGISNNYHEYAYGPVRDSKGNFYGALNLGHDEESGNLVHDSIMNRSAKYRGWFFQINTTGEFVPWASGLRSPCGVGINKDDELFYTDNQGDWVPTSTLHHVVKGRFYGHPASLEDHPDFLGKDLNAITVEKYDTLRTKPIVWIPYGELANSPGNLAFNETQGKFGPFEDQIFIGDQTLANVMRVVLEKVQGEYQGVVFNFVNGLQCGVIRNRFDKDGSLWLGQGARGWNSVGPKPFGIQKIVWDGKTIPTEMHAISLTDQGFKITFTKPMRESELKDLSSYTIKHWGYKYDSHYGSDKMNITSVDIKKINVVNSKTVELELPLVTDRVYHIECRVKADDNSELKNRIGYYTLNRLR